MGSEIVKREYTITMAFRYEGDAPPAATEVRELLAPLAAIAYRGEQHVVHITISDSAIGHSADLGAAIRYAQDLVLRVLDPLGQVPCTTELSGLLVEYPRLEEVKA